MKISTNELWQSAKVLTLALILSVGVSTAFAWTGPTATAPAGNTSAPVNVSATSQVKSGGLGVTNLVADQLCLGTSCITAWPTGGGGSSQNHYQCPEAYSANGVSSGPWASYGCVGQIWGSPTCRVTVYPQTQTYACTLISNGDGSGDGLGYGQTWKDVTGSRILNTTYTNTTTKPIVISAMLPGAMSPGIGVSIFVDGMEICNSYVSGNTSGAVKTNCSVIVPVGSTYVFKNSAPSNAFVRELR